MSKRHDIDPDAQPVRFLGTTDDVTQCDCCGKANLKSTVALSIGGGDPVFFGVTCAARAIGRTAKEVRNEAKHAEREIARLVSHERKRIHDADFEEQRQWFNEQVPGMRDDRFKQIQALGGWGNLQALGLPSERRHGYERVERVVRARYMRGETRPLTDDDYDGEP